MIHLCAVKISIVTFPLNKEITVTYNSNLMTHEKIRHTTQLTTRQLWPQNNIPPAIQVNEVPSSICHLYQLQKQTCWFAFVANQQEKSSSVPHTSLLRKKKFPDNVVSYQPFFHLLWGLSARITSQVQWLTGFEITK